VGLFDESSSNQTTLQQQQAGETQTGDINQLGGSGTGNALNGSNALTNAAGNVVGSGTALTNSYVGGNVTISAAPQITEAALNTVNQATSDEATVAEDSVAALEEDTTTALADASNAQASNSQLANAVQAAFTASPAPTQSAAIIPGPGGGFNLSPTETILAAVAALLAILFYLHHSK
jgi:hypothetical protein